MKRPLCVDCIHENVYPNVEPCFSCEPFGRTNFIAKPQAKQSNYARIRNKTPEELGKTLASLIWHWKCCDTEADTAQDLIDWLYKEAEE